MTKYTYRVPSAEELYALEMQARRMRSQAMAEAFRKAAAAIKGLFAHSPRIARHA